MPRQATRFVLLAHLDDRVALQVFAFLSRRHGAEAVQLISSEELVMAPRWTHRLDGSGTHTVIELASGTVLDSDRVGVVLNRLRYVTMPHFQASAEVDREYAVMEMYALLLSWLRGLPCPVHNRPSGRGLTGREGSDAEWLGMAGQAGLPVLPYGFATDPRRHGRGDLVPLPRGNATAPVPILGRRATWYGAPLSGRRRTLVIGGDACAGDAPAHWEPGFRRLRELSGCALLELELAETAAGEWMVASASAFPKTESEQTVRIIAALLESAASRAQVAP